MKSLNARMTPANITSVKENEVFVFGANEGYRHGKGAAKTALSFGAKHGEAGLVGRTYGIPTKDKAIFRTLTIPEIKKHVDTFLSVAASRPDLTFLVTEIGTGLAGHKIKDIAPLFAKAIHIENIHLPERFWHKIL